MSSLIKVLSVRVLNESISFNFVVIVVVYLLTAFFSLKFGPSFCICVLCLQAEPQSQYLPSLSLDWKWAKRGKLLCGDVPVCAITVREPPSPFLFVYVRGCV